jgi:ABC-type glycerol-3-phosphate transport system permease component
VSLAFFVVWTIVPFMWMILASVKTNKEIYQDFTFLPKEVYFGHYQALLGGKFGIWMRNSTLIASVATLLSIVLGSLAAYAITRLRFAGRRVLMRIVLPLSAPALVVVCLFSFTQAWNEFIFALVMTNSVAARTVTVGLTQMLGEDVFYWGQMMAGALITALPPVIMYTLAQRLVVRGLAVGGVKG